MYFFFFTYVTFPFFSYYKGESRTRGESLRAHHPLRGRSHIHRPHLPHELQANERKLSKKVTYYDVPGAPDSTPRVAYRPTVARGSYRPTGVQGNVDPEKEKRIEKEKERESTEP